MNVDTVLKGAIDQKEKLSFQYTLLDETIGYSPVTAPSYQIVFLAKLKTGYSFTSPYHPSLPAVPGLHFELGDPLENISALLGAVVQSPVASTDQKQLALYAVSTIRIPQSTSVLRNTLLTTDSALRLNAAGFLLLRNDLTGLDLAASYLLRPEGNAPRYLLHNLDYAISEGIKDDRAVPTLSRLLQAKQVETRRAAASALRHIGSHSALKPLAYALEDGDFEVRGNAVIGLGTITGQFDWTPNMEILSTDEPKYLKHWREWASAEGLLK